MRPKKKITCEELLSLIPEELLEQIGKDTKVDFSVSKLTGKNMFTLLLYGFISGKELSLQILEDIFHSPLLQKLNGGKHIHRSALGYRLSEMNVQYFKQIFDHLVEDARVDRYMGTAGKKYVLKKVDSTIVTLSAKLFAEGMKINEETRDVKFSIGIMDSLPLEVALFTGQSYASEDKALKEIIQRKREKQREKITILLFDRGIQSRDTMDEIHEQKEIFFVTRLSGQSYKVDTIHSEVKGRKAGELILESDEEIHFESKKEKRDKTYRLVTAIDPETKKEYQFLTDVLFFNAVEICDLYKQRWEIETFFKFIKQQLNFSQLVSRSLNGIEIMMYMTLIAAILIAIYKKVNKVETWGSAKRRFTYELEANILEIFSPNHSRGGFGKNISRRLAPF